MIARVIVDTPLAHLDRPFDYSVPDGIDVVAGCRVKVRFAGRLVDGLVAELADHSAFDKLAPIHTVVSSEAVLTSDVLRLARAVADRYAGTVNDVLRLAIPKRHARAERASWPKPAGELPAAPRWSPRREVWSVLPRDDPAERAATLALSALHAGRGSIIVVPDTRDVARWNAVFRTVLGEGRHAVLTAADKAEQRYRAFLGVARGDVRIVLGTRAAAFAPVHDVGFVALWDDGDDLLAEPRAPYAHAREVLLIRAIQADAAVLLAGHARTAEAQSLVRSGWCTSREPDPETRRAAWPRLDITGGTEGGETPGRLPSRVLKAIRETEGAVLVQVPRRGYRSSLTCQSCRRPARCRACGGPLAQPAASAAPACRWCNENAADWRCPDCGGTRFRAPVIGHLRTAEEFARTFPMRDVVTSGGDRVLDVVAAKEALVLATPGAEPRVADGFALVVLLDTWLMLARDDVRVFEESHRRWFNALALCGAAGRAVAVGDSATLQYLVRADPVGLAERELDDRTSAHLPPAARLAAVDGPQDVLEALALRSWTDHTEVLGPVAADAADRLILRAPRTEGAALARALKGLAAERSAAKVPPVRIHVDPQSF